MFGMIHPSHLWSLQDLYRLRPEKQPGVLWKADFGVANCRSNVGGVGWGGCWGEKQSNLPASRRMEKQSSPSLNSNVLEIASVPFAILSSNVRLGTGWLLFKINVSVFLLNYGGDDFQNRPLLQTPKQTRFFPFIVTWWSECEETFLSTLVPFFRAALRRCSRVPQQLFGMWR